MADSTSASLIDAIGTALQRVTTANGYTYDLSGFGNVIYGIYDQPPSKSKPAQVAFFEDRLNARGEGVPLTMHGRAGAYVIYGWVQAGKTPLARAQAVMDLRSDVIEALERGVEGKPTDTPPGGDMATVGGVPLTLVELSGMALEGSAVGLDGWAMFSLDLALEWRQAHGG